jgi:hypothetical protein
VLVELSVMEQRYQAVLAVTQDAGRVVEVAEPCGPGTARSTSFKEWCSFELHTVVVDSGESPLEDDEFRE